VAAAERTAIRSAEAPASTRTFAMATGGLGLIAVGLLMVTITPGRLNAPVAVSATTSPLAGGGGASIAAIAPFGRDDFVITPVDGEADLIVATPIGDGALALAMMGESTPGDGFDVQLVSGPVVTAAVLGVTSDGLTLLAVEDTGDGHSIADQRPDPDEIVTVLASPPVTVAFADVSTVTAGDGTPVIDARGALVGLCASRRHGAAMTMIDVTSGSVVTDPTATSVPPVSAAPTDGATTAAP
jgi:hypothetical protein